MYIKLFENFEGSYWKLEGEDVFDSNPYFNRSYDDFTRNEFDIIKRLCPENFSIKEGSLKVSRGLPSPSYLIELLSKESYCNIVDIQITKYEDEWFSVDINYVNGDIDVWVCDQFDGLKEFIQTI